MHIHASDMVLNVHIDASNLFDTKARSRFGAFMRMGTELRGARPNAPVLYLSIIISAKAAEYVAVFIAAHEAISLRLVLGGLSYTHPAT